MEVPMALPLYPQLKIELENWFLEIMRDAARKQLGPFRQSPRFIQHEGERHTYNTIQGEERTTDYQNMGVEITINLRDIPGMTLEDALKLITEKGAELGSMEARYHFQRLNDIISEVGNIVEGQGGPITFDLWMEMFEKLHVAFDDYGRPQMPTMVIPPHMRQSFEDMMREAAADESARDRLLKALEQKWKEWNEEQDRRKLVD